MITKDDIKAWLKATNKTRQDLAESMGVSRGTINNWLSGADPIPALKLQLIERLMQEYEDPAPAMRLCDITAFAIMVANADKEFIAEAAKAKGMTFDDFVMAASMKWAKDILENSEK